MHLPKWEIRLSMRVIAKTSLKKVSESPSMADAQGPRCSPVSELPICGDSFDYCQPDMAVDANVE